MVGESDVWQRRGIRVETTSLDGRPVGGSETCFIAVNHTAPRTLVTFKVSTLPSKSLNHLSIGQLDLFTIAPRHARVQGNVSAG